MQRRSRKYEKTVKEPIRKCGQTKEALRYLGLGKHEPDPETERLLEECIREAERAAEFRHLVREYPLLCGRGWNRSMAAASG